MKNSRLLIIGIVVVVIIAVFLASISYYIHATFKVSVPTYVSYGKPYFNYSIYTDGILGYQNNQYAVPFAIINYTSSNAIYANISLSVYASEPSRNIYYVSSPAMCIDCFPDSDVERSLNYYLNRYNLLSGASFNVVNIQNIYSIPPGSIVILQTGLLPVSMMPYSGYAMNTTLLSLLSKGDVVVYVGDNFSRSIGTGSIIFKTSQQSLQALSSAGISWGTPYTKGDFFYFRNPTFSLANAYYNISYAQVLNGTFIAFSNMPTSSWPNASYMARDIAIALHSRFWIPLIAYGSYSLTTPSTGSIGILALQKYLTFQNISTINNTYPLIEITLSNSTNFTIMDSPIYIYSKLNGSLSIPGLIGETQTVPITIGMNVNSTHKVLVIPHIDLYSSNMSYVTSIPIGFFNTSTGINIIKYESFGLPSGYYIAILRDFHNRPYAASLFQLAGVDITPVSMNFANGSFVFALSSLGMPIANSPYSISLDNSYLTSGITNNSEIIYNLPKGSIVGYGTQTFAIDIFNTKYVYTTSYIKKILHIPSYYIEFGIVAIIVIILNLVLRAPNRDEYYIDVPDFPPSKKTQITINKSEITGLFEKINLHYHWKYMPLLPEEIKSGITSNIRYNNMPVSITLQNVIGLLTKLVNSGELVNIGNYYAPKKWIDESGYSVEYLATFRKLRDYCVTTGFLFTDLGASQDSDMVISKSGMEADIFIYAESGRRSKIRIGGERKTYLVFFDEERRLKFMEGLYASFGDESELLKMAITNGLIKIVDAEHLSQLVI
mgnify:FL=1